MGLMASYITGVSIVYSTFCSGADQRQHQRSVSLAFVRGIHRWPVNSPHKGPVTWKMFQFDDVIMCAWNWLRARTLISVLVCFLSWKTPPMATILWDWNSKWYNEQICYNVFKALTISYVLRICSPWRKAVAHNIRNRITVEEMFMLALAHISSRVCFRDQPLNFQFLCSKQE